MIVCKSKNFLIIALLLFSCTNSTLTKRIEVKNDTTEVVRLLIDSAFYRHNLPDINALTKNSPFGDTIILCKDVYQGDSIILKYFAQGLNGIKFKFLTHYEICSLARNLHNDTVYFPNFLELRSFRKVDTTYEVYLQNDCVIPQYDKLGHHLVYGSDTSKCILECCVGEA